MYSSWKQSTVVTITQSGFVSNTINLITGPAGSGKSLFGMQFIYNGVRLYDETGIFITLEEGSDNIRNTMMTHNMDINKYINEGKLYIIDLGEVEKDTSKTARHPFGTTYPVPEMPHPATSECPLLLGGLPDGKDFPR